MTAELSREARKRLRWIDHYLKHGNASLTSRYFGISRTTLNKWPRAKVEIQKGREGILGRMLWNVFWVIPIDREATHMEAVSYTHLRAHETRHDLVCRL